MPSRLLVRVGLLAGLVGLPGVTLGGQSPKQRLAQATKVDCTFTLSVLSGWKGTAPDATIKPSQLHLQFDEVNSDEGSARIVGSFGPSDIVVRLSSDTLHFIQSFRDGPLYTTTVFSKERNGRFQAVHSRHEFTEFALPGYTSSPEQYYGNCSISP